MIIPLHVSGRLRNALSRSLENRILYWHTLCALIDYILAVNCIFMGTLML
ncbi:hypothetical protein Lalb_Chr19g0128721 [Lupinus albus]|uniref:Uncharacterized protein n=1 Tax=Lupinus albus TaxID=3870 RepID=A0A6A4NSI6_LUPAL|nr:hypothetical protein Lalb_Chr19g0128721 [Lupinus albus]